MRRTTLHRIIAERAEQLGIEFLWRTSVTGIPRDGVQLGEQRVFARAGLLAQMDPTHS